MASEPHRISAPTTRKQVERLLRKHDRYADGKLRRLAIASRLATMDTAIEEVRHRLWRFLRDNPEN